MNKILVYRVKQIGFAIVGVVLILLASKGVFDHQVSGRRGVYYYLESAPLIYILIVTVKYVLGMVALYKSYSLNRPEKVKD